jgi:branched-chain amino acid transport system substrate-binding protein
LTEAPHHLPLVSLRGAAQLRRRAPGRPALGSLCVLVMTLALVGCPRRFDPAAAPAISASNPRVAGSFEGCQRLFAGAKLGKADGCFARFIELHPKEPLSRSARLYRGRIALSRGDAKVAAEQLGPLQGELAKAGAGATPAEQAMERSARYYLGLALARLGQHQRVVTLLTPLVATIDAASLPALAAALAVAQEARGALSAAAQTLQRLHRATKRPVERLHARLSLERIVTKLGATALSKALSAAPAGSLLRGLCARRALEAAQARGDLARATQLRNDHADALGRHGLLVAPQRGARVGLLLPFTGPYARVGRLALAGAAIAAGAFSSGPRPLELLVRDSGKGALVAARELLRRERVSVLVGAFDGRRAAQLAALAAAARVPFLTLSPRPAGRSPWMLRVVPSLRARVSALVSRLISERPGVRVLVLAPETRFGRRAAGAFSAALRRRGGRVASVHRYPSRAKSFVRLAKRVASSSRYDAIFVADGARRLALLAPALAQAGLWSRSKAGKAPKGGRAIRLLATADGLSPRLLRSAGRYVQGALLAPGFYADEASPTLGPLLRHYRAAAGRAPGLVEAYAHDAVAAARAALAAGTRSPLALRATLQRASTRGLSGGLGFTAGGRRASTPPIYVVVGKAIRLIEPAPAKAAGKPSS